MGRGGGRPRRGLLQQLPPTRAWLIENAAAPRPAGDLLDDRTCGRAGGRLNVVYRRHATPVTGSSAGAHRLASLAQQDAPTRCLTSSHLDRCAGPGHAAAARGATAIGQRSHARDNGLE